MSTRHTESITAEVAGLVDTIKSQAHEYSEVLRELRLRAEALEKERTEVNNRINELHNSTDRALESITRTEMEALAVIEPQVRTVEKIYTDFQSIEPMRTALADLLRTINLQKNEIETYLKSIDGRVQKIAEEYSQGVEITIERKLKDIDSQFQKLDQRILTLFDAHRKEIEHIYEDIDKIRSKMHDSRIVFENAKKSVNSIIDDAQTSINSKILAARVELEKDITTATLSLQTTSEQLKNSLDSLIDRAKNERSLLDRKMQLMEESLKMTRILSIVAIISAFLISGVAILLK